MAPGLAIGCVVNALAHKVLGGKRAKHRFGGAWKREVRGKVKAMVGIGRSRKWECYFEELQMSCTMLARSLVTLHHKQADGDEKGRQIEGEFENDKENNEQSNDAGKNELEGDGEVISGEGSESESGSNELERDERESEVDLEHDMNVDGGDTDDILMCNGLKWNVIDVITEDCRILPHTRAAIMWNNQRTEADRTILDYFQLSFPMQMVDDIVTWSSKAIPSGKPPMTSWHYADETIWFSLCYD